MASGVPPGIDLSANQQNAVIGSVAATWALASIALVLRLTCRRISKAGFWWDDYLMIPAFIFTSIASWMTLTWLPMNNFGKHIYSLPPASIMPSVTVFLKSLIAVEICYTGTIVFAKFSILAFYWRLFNLKTFVRYSVMVIAVIVTCWGLAVFLIVVTQCRPLRAFWDKTLPASSCTVDSYKFFYGNSTPNIITDILLLLTPLPAIWSLRLSPRQKVSLSCIFLVGIFVTAVSITRLVYLVTLNIKDADVTWVFVQPQIWTCVELNIAVVCGCLPQLRPLILLITTGSPMTSSSAPSKHSHNPTGRSSRGFFSSKGSTGLGDTAVTVASVNGPGAHGAQEGFEGEKRNSDSTLPLVPPTAYKSGGARYIELGRMEAGTKKPGVWDINVRREYDVSTSSQADSASL